MRTIFYGYAAGRHRLRAGITCHVELAWHWLCFSYRAGKSMCRRQCQYFFFSARNSPRGLFSSAVKLTSGNEVRWRNLDWGANADLDLQTRARAREWRWPMIPNDVCNSTLVLSYYTRDITSTLLYSLSKHITADLRKPLRKETRELPLLVVGVYKSRRSHAAHVRAKWQTINRKSPQRLEKIWFCKTSASRTAISRHWSCER